MIMTEFFFLHEKKIFFFCSFSNRLIQLFFYDIHSHFIVYYFHKFAHNISLFEYMSVISSQFNPKKRIHIRAHIHTYTQHLHLKIPHRFWIWIFFFFLLFIQSIYLFVCFCFNRQHSFFLLFPFVD